MTKQKAELVYTTIHHDIRNDLNISIMEYCVADSIDKLSRKKRYDYTCKASKQWIADCIGTSKRTIITCINNLEGKGLVERVNGGQDVRPTDKWHDSVNARSEDTSHPREDTSHQKATNREDTSPPSNKNNTNKNNNSIDYGFWVDKWNEINDAQCRVTDKKRKHIRQRLDTWSKDELIEAMENRANDEWINNEGSKYKTRFISFWRNDEKVEEWLHRDSSHQEKQTSMYSAFS